MTTQPPPTPILATRNPQTNALAHQASGTVMNFLRFSLAIFLVSCAVRPARAQSGFGEVLFANSGSAAAQGPFQLGVAQLHDFEYGPAADSFRKAQQMDPGFAMAYWGEAMTKNHPLWRELDLPGARSVLERLGPSPEARAGKAVTAREKAYLHAVELLFGNGSKQERDARYSDAMGALYRDQPGDVDAGAFYALSIMGLYRERDQATYMRAAAILEEMYSEHHNHPGINHYLIHAYDDPVHAPLGLRAARLYSKVAPDAPHALHMTSHIFIAMGMWDEVIAANLRALNVADAKRKARGLPPVACGHGPTWLEYGYLQTGNKAAARQLLVACHDLAQQDKSYDATYRPVASDLDRFPVGSFAAMRVTYLIDSQDWQDEAADWPLPSNEFPAANLTYAYGSALVFIHRGDLSKARLALAQMQAAHQQFVAQLEEHHLPVEAPGHHASIQEQQIRALILDAEGKKDQAIHLLEQAAAEEKDLPFVFGPPFIEKPSFELLAEAWLSAGKTAEPCTALQFQSTRTPGRRLTTALLSKCGPLTNADVTKPASDSPQADHSHH